MARKTEIVVEIDPDGGVRIEVQGIKGKRCMDYVEVFQEVLGTVTSRGPTSEYYQEEAETRRVVESKVKS